MVYVIAFLVITLGKVKLTEISGWLKRLTVNQEKQTKEHKEEIEKLELKIEELMKKVYELIGRQEEQHSRFFNWFGYRRK